ncbi:RNA polymerase sigma-70 factor [Mucilaginibacter robiniae]|uniref:RNA polymerase sigma-70 factor n=1 Tax=Mucilaginibacter robiniae TaxID=2728022 RepID=A0A7L5E794_9SPHI|nr:RNA polymerase sigma-70 factor [Mucilaginibacter robiniae]QJD96236.1 RNA polymerase sigma-70 factor [Mucilaginibacter robiniae]
MVKKYDDQQLVEALQAGEKAAITEIYRRYWQRLLAIAYNHTKDKASAEEVVQEVLIKLWDNRNKIRPHSLPNYLATAVKYSVLTHLYREKRRSNIAASLYLSQEMDLADERIYARFLQQYIDGVVDLLPEKCRLVFQHSRLQGKNNAQIAREMQIAEKTVEAHLTKALKTIRYSLKSAGLLIILQIIQLFV